MVDYSLARPTEDHIGLISSTMRHDDLLEVGRAGFATAKEALTYSVDLSDESWVWLADSRPLAIFGLVLGDTLSGPWLLTAVGVEDHGRAFARLSKWFAKRLAKEHGELVALIDVEYTKSIRWASWMGFDVSHVIDQFSVGGEYSY